MSGQRRGTARERALAERMESEDWFVTRAAGSHGPADLVALRVGSIPRLIQVKSDARYPYAHFGPADRAELSAAAKRAGAEAWLVWHPPRGKPHWISENEWPRQAV